MMRKIFCLFFLCFIASDCDEQQKPNGPTTRPVVAEWKNDRFLVQSYGKFEAGYGSNEREILVITDTASKIQYLAITGCGTTELRTVTEGETTVTREE